MHEITHTSLLTSIPPVVWSGIVAAVVTAAITLVGVLISNRSQTNRLLFQLRAEERRQDLNQNLTMRRDLYLNAIDAVEAFSEVVVAGVLGQKSWRECSQASKKTHLLLTRVTMVSDGDVASSAFEMSSFLSKRLKESATFIQDNNNIRKEIEEKKKASESLAKRIDSDVSKIRDFLRSCAASNESKIKPSYAKMEIQIVDSAIKRNDDLLAEIKKLAGEYSLKAPAAATKIAEWLPLLTEHQVELMSYMRNELGLRSNISPVLERWIVKDQIAAKDAISELASMSENINEAKNEVAVMKEEMLGISSRRENSKGAQESV